MKTGKIDLDVYNYIRFYNNVKNDNTVYQRCNYFAIITTFM